MRLIIILILLNAKAATGQISPDSLFEKTKGTWIFPVDKITYVYTQSSCNINTILCSFINGLTIESDSCVNAYFVQPGRVVIVTKIGISYLIIVRQGNYFLSYFGLAKVNVKKADNVLAGQPIGSLSEFDKGIFKLDIILNKGDKSIRHLDKWFCKDFQKFINHNIID